MRARRLTAVPAVLASLLFVAACGDSTPDERPAAGPSASDRFELSGSAAGPFDFGSGADKVVAGVSERFGDPDVTVGPERYHRHAGRDAWFEDEGDPLSPAWDYPVLSVSCWQALCLVFGGQAEAELALRGWELTSHNRWSENAEADPTSPEVTLAGTGIRLGDSWKELHAAYPSTTVGGAEGNSLAVKNTPWNGIFDGAATWRLSGPWDYEHPTTVPPGAALTRISAGEGPEPGCC